MSSSALESFLARIYVDPEARTKFLADPRSMARSAGLNDAECEAVAAIDRTSLEMASASFARKRANKARVKPVGTIRRWIERCFPISPR